jgi:hypothetical protein
MNNWKRIRLSIVLPWAKSEENAKNIPDA